MRKKKLLIGLLTVICAFSLVACGSDKDDKDKDSDKEKTTVTEKTDIDVSEDISDDTTEATEQEESKEVTLAWLKEHGPNFRKDASVISDSNIAVLPGNPTIDTALDAYMSWYVVGDGYPQFTECLSNEIKPDMSKNYVLKETKELAESFDKGPKGETWVRFENHSEEVITVQQAIENKWFIIEFCNDKKVYSSNDSAVYINLGYTSQKGYANSIDDVVVLNDYLLKYYGEPNFFGVCMNYDYQSIDEVIAGDESRTTYDIGWIGDEYGVFVTIRYDELTKFGDLCVDVDDIMIIPTAMLENTCSFSTAPYHTDITVYDANLIK